MIKKLILVTLFLSVSQAFANQRFEPALMKTYVNGYTEINTGLTNTEAVDTCSGISIQGGMFFTFFDSVGNDVWAPPGTLVTITDSGSMTFYSDSLCTKQVTSPIALGSDGNKVPVFFKDTKAENLTLILSAAGVRSIFRVNFVNAPVTTLRLINNELPGWNDYSKASSNYVYGGNPASFQLPQQKCIGGFAIEAFGSDGSPAKATENITVEYQNYYKKIMYTDSQCTQALYQLTIQTGHSASQPIYIKGTSDSDPVHAFYSSQKFREGWINFIVAYNHLTFF